MMSVYNNLSELDQKQPDCCVRYKDILPSLYETECTSKGEIQFLCEEKFQLNSFIADQVDIKKAWRHHCLNHETDPNSTFSS